MKGPVLTLRISRRAIGAAVLTGDELSFLDGRHLRSRTSRAVPAAVRYLRRVIELTQPGSIVIDAPRKPGSTTDQILTELVSQSPSGGVPELLPTANLLVAFGAPALSSRADLRATAQHMFPQLSTASGSVKPYLIDASAIALYTEALTALGGTV